MNLPHDLRNYRAPFSLKRWLRDNETAILRPFAIIGIAFLLAALIGGCAAPGFDYAWTQARPAS